MNCSVCGKNTTFVNTSGRVSKMAHVLNIEYLVDDNDIPEYGQHIKNLLGVYKPNERYVICPECVLRAYGVKQ